MNITWKKVCLLLIVFIGVFLCAFFFVHNSKKSKDNEKKSDVVWNGESVVVYEDKEVKVKFFTTSQDEYGINDGKFSISLQNKSKKSVSYSINIVGINNSINCEESALFYKMSPKSTEKKEVGISSYTNLARVLKIDSLQIEIEKLGKYGVTVKKKKVEVKIQNMKKAAKVFESFRGMRAQKQTLVKTKQVIMNINAVGRLDKDYDTDGKIWYSIENLSDEALNFGIDQICINGFSFDANGGDSIAAKSIYYDSISLDSVDLDLYGITSINSLSMHLTDQVSAIRFNTESEKTDFFGWHNIKLEKKGEKTGKLDKDNKLLFDKDDLRIAYSNTVKEYDDYYKANRYTWYFNLENNTKRNIEVELINCKPNTKFVDKDDYCVISHNIVGAKQKRKAQIFLAAENFVNKKSPTILDLRFMIIDKDTEEILGKTSPKRVKINLAKEKTDEKTAK